MGGGRGMFFGARVGVAAGAGRGVCGRCVVGAGCCGARGCAGVGADECGGGAEAGGFTGGVLGELPRVQRGDFEVVDVDRLAALADEAGDVGLIQVGDELGRGEAALISGRPGVAALLEDVDVDTGEVPIGEGWLGRIGGLAELVGGEDGGEQDRGIFGYWAGHTRSMYGL